MKEDIKDSIAQDQTGLAGEYAQGESERQPYIDRAKLVASVTIPALSPSVLKYSSGKMHYTSQGLGSFGVNNLSSKLLLTLAPPNTSVFRLSPSEKVREEIEEAKAQEGQENIETDIEKSLAKQERIVTKNMEQSGDRVKIGNMLKLALIQGNALVDTHGKKSRIIPLTSFICKRDTEGDPIKIIVKEEVAPSILKARDPKLFEKIKDMEQFKRETKEGGDVTIYTECLNTGDNWKCRQEVLGEPVEGTEGVYPLDSPRYIPIAPNRLDGEDYGRPYIEDFIGDLITLEFLTRAIKEGAEAASRFLLFVNPNGMTSAADIAEAENGDVLIGSGTDVTSLQIMKNGDLAVAERIIAAIEKRLERAFLLHSSVQRNAERVTAEEIRFMAAELEAALGGFYSVIAEDFQKPYVRRRIDKLRKSGAIANIPKGATEITIVTGIEALGRGHDRNKLLGFLKTIVDTMGPQAIVEEINRPELIKRLALSDGIDTEGLIKTIEQKNQEQTQQQQQMLAQQATPEVIKQAGAAFQQQQQQTEG